MMLTVGCAVITTIEMGLDEASMDKDSDPADHPLPQPIPQLSFCPCPGRQSTVGLARTPACAIGGHPGYATPFLALANHG